MQDEIYLGVETKIYSLKQVDIVRESTYAQFVHAFRNMPWIETDQDKVRESLGDMGTQIAEAIAWGKTEATYRQNTGLGIHSSFGRTDIITRERQEVARLKHIEYESREFYHYTSRENLKLFTGYDGVCLDSFIVFFNSKYDVNYKTKIPDLLATISDAYKDFKDLYQDAEWYAFDSVQVE